MANPVNIFMPKNSYEDDVLLAIKYHYGNSRDNNIVISMIEYHAGIRPCPLDAYRVIYDMFAERLNKNSDGRFLNKFHQILSDNARLSNWLDAETDRPSPAQFIFDSMVSAVRLTPYVDFGFEDNSSLPPPDPEFFKFLEQNGYIQ